MSTAETVQYCGGPASVLSTAIQRIGRITSSLKGSRNNNVVESLSMRRKLNNINKLIGFRCQFTAKFNLCLDLLTDLVETIRNGKNQGEFQISY